MSWFTWIQWRIYSLYYPQKLLATDLLVRFLFLSPAGSLLLLCFLILIFVENLISMIGFEEPGVIAMLMFISCFSWHSLLSYCLDAEEIPHLFYVFRWWLHSSLYEIASRTSLDRTVHSVWVRFQYFVIASWCLISLFLTRASCLSYHLSWVAPSTLSR